MIAAVAASWPRGGFSGRAWSDDLRVGIAAPPYADSVIVSGPGAVIDHLTGSGLEAFRVGRQMRLPDMVE